MRTKKLETIICPDCGWEYLPAEIYVPMDFFGSPKTIIRNNEGKVEHFTGKSIDGKETYVCDNCGCKFNIIARLSFSTKKEEFEEESVTVISHDLVFEED